MLVCDMIVEGTRGQVVAYHIIRIHRPTPNWLHRLTESPFLVDGFPSVPTSGLVTFPSKADITIAFETRFDRRSKVVGSLSQTADRESVEIFKYLCEYFDWKKPKG